MPDKSFTGGHPMIWKHTFEKLEEQEGMEIVLVHIFGTVIKILLLLMKILKHTARTVKGADGEYF